MKNIALPILVFLVTVIFSYGQIPDQNPNYQTSLDIYTKKILDSGYTNTMSTTVQDTYKAIDEWQDKKDRKIENDRLARQYRQERRLARINRPSYYSNRYAYSQNGYGYNNLGFGYSNGYNNNFGYGYGQGYGQGNGYGYGSPYGYGNSNGYGSNAAYCLPYSYPLNYRLGGSVRIGRNVWLGF